MTLKATIKRLSAGNLKTTIEKLSAGNLKAAIKRLFTANLKARMERLSAANLKATVNRLSTRKIISIVNASLVTAALLSLLLLARDTVSLVFTGAPDDGGPAETGAKPLEQKARKALMDYAPVLKKNVFGFPAGELVPITSPSEPVAEVAPEPVDIKLVGAVAWPGGFGYAIVEGGPEGQEVYKTGDTIKGVGLLSRVESYGIVLDKDGREVRVSLEELAEPSASRPRKSKGRRKPVKRTRAPDKKSFSRQPPAANGFARQTAKNEFVVNRKAIDESLGNPRNVLTDARLLPRMVEGTQEGFVMSEVTKGGLYDTLGLKNGDVLLSVNDFKLSNPETSLQAFTALRGMDRIKLDIMRGGKKMTLTYTIR